MCVHFIAHLRSMRSDYVHSFFSWLMSMCCGDIWVGGNMRCWGIHQPYGIGLLKIPLITIPHLVRRAGS